MVDVIKPFSSILCFGVLVSDDAKLNKHLGQVISKIIQRFYYCFQLNKPGQTKEVHNNTRNQTGNYLKRLEMLRMYEQEQRIERYCVINRPGVARAVL